MMIKTIDEIREELEYLDNHIAGLEDEHAHHERAANKAKIEILDARFRRAGLRRALIAAGGEPS